MSPEMDARNHNLPTYLSLKRLVHVSSELLEDHRQTESYGHQNLPDMPRSCDQGENETCNLLNSIQSQALSTRTRNG